MKQVWLEKYRPQTLQDVQGNAPIVDTLKCLLNQGNVPHLILTGPPGVGKTSSLLCLARQHLGDKFSEAYKELNASDQRGIDVVRDQIKSFAKKKVNLPPGVNKIILLDEADSLTEGAMHALRMIMSNESETTRFALSCNNEGKIIEAIQSRCAILRFNKLSESQTESGLAKIAKQQNVKITQKAFQTMLFIADGDMRVAINNLQACHFSSQGRQVDESTVLHICDSPSIDEIRQILLLASKKDIRNAVKRMHVVYKEGHSVYDIVHTMNKVLLGLETQIHREKLFQMLKNAALLKMRVLDGLTSEIQIGKYLAQCAQL